MAKKDGDYRVLVVATLLAGFFLRVWRLGVQSLWYDETVSAYLAGQPLHALIHHTSLDIHPPLYYALLRFWTLLAGRSEFSLGFFSVIFGWLHIPLVYLLGKEVGGKKLGVLSAAVIAFSTFDIWYAQEVRMYSLGSFLGLVGLTAIIKAIKGDESSRPPALWSLVGILGMYTLYYFGFLLASEALIILAWIAAMKGKKRVKAARKWLPAMAAIPIAYIPWIPIAWRQATNPPVPPWRSFVGLGKTLSTAWAALCMGQSANPRDVIALLVFFLLLYALGVWKVAESGRSKWIAGVLVGYTFLPLAIIYLISLRIPLYHPRYMALYAAPFSVVVAGGLYALFDLGETGRAISLLALALVVVSNGYSLYNFHFDNLYASDDYRSGVGLIEKEWAPGDAVLVNAGYVYTAFDYYFHDKIAWQGKLRDYYGCPEQKNGIVVVETGTVGGPPELGWGHPEADFYSISPTETGGKLALLFRCHPRVWQLRAYDTVTDPKGFIRKWLDSNAVLLWDTLLTGETNAKVQAWRTNTPGPAPGNANAEYPAAGLALQGWRIYGPAAEGEKVGAVLWWKAVESPSPRPQIGLSLRLLGKDGTVWAQQDFSPEGNVYPMSRWKTGESAPVPVSLRVPFGTVPGRYRLALVVYDRKDGKPFVERRTGKVRLDLGEVEVLLPKSWPRRIGGWPRHARISSGGVELYGMRVELEKRIKAGQKLPLDMLWKISGKPKATAARLVLLGRRGKVVSTQDVGIPRAGRFVRTKASILVPGYLRNGSYALYLQLLDGNGKALGLRKWGLIPIGARWEIGKVRVAERKINTKVPPMSHLLSARFGQWGMLLGYDLAPEEPSRGGKLRITLYWRSIAPTDKSYKVFVHLVDGKGKLVAQSDSYPQNGRLPTSAWVAGEVIEDVHELTIPASAPPGEYHLEIGMYIESTGVRALVSAPSGEGKGDHVVIPVRIR